MADIRCKIKEAPMEGTPLNAELLPTQRLNNVKLPVTALNFNEKNCYRRLCLAKWLDTPSQLC